MNLPSILTWLGLMLPAAGASCPGAGTEAEAICSLLMAQQEAWNRGDLDAFLSGYEQNGEVTFIGRAGVQRGITAIASRYRQAYGTRAAMGRLRFRLLEVRLIGPRVALVLGQFELEREAGSSGPASGFFSLVLRQQGGQWRILHDHTS